MRKLFSFMLMAVGLLISGNLRAETVQVTTVDQLLAALNAGNTAEITKTIQLYTSGTHDLTKGNIKVASTGALFLMSMTVDAAVTIENNSNQISNRISNGTNFEGTLINNGTEEVWSGANFKGTLINNGTLTIKGGTFTGTITATGGTITINGGKFSSNPESLRSSCTLNLPPDYTGFEEKDGYWVLGNPSEPSEPEPTGINLIHDEEGKYYDSFDAAYAAADNGDVIEIDKNKIDNVVMPSMNKGINITIKGIKDSQYSDAPTLTINSSVTWQNVTIEDVRTIEINNTNADVTMNGTSINTTGSAITITHAKSLSLDGCTVVAAGNNGINAGFADGIETITVNNSSITAKSTAIYSNAGTCSLTGTTNLKINETDEYKEVLDGGATFGITPYTVTFNKDLSANVKGNTYKTAIKDGLWVVIEGLAPFTRRRAGAADVDISTIEDAFANIQSGDKIILNKDLAIGNVQLTVPAGVALTFDLNGHNISVDRSFVGTPYSSIIVEGALTVTNSSSTPGSWKEVEMELGDASRTGYQAIQVVNGGKLTIQGTNKNIELFANVIGISAEVGSELNIDNAIINAKYNAAVYFEGKKSVIKNCEIASQSSTSLSGDFYSYAVRVLGNMIIENTTVDGVQGAVGVEKKDTRLTVRGCDFKAAGTNSHYALYVCQLAVADVFNSKFMSDIEHCVFVGNNDVSTEWGIINLYEGNMLKDKAYSQKAKTADAKFPSYIPKTSTWYINWETGSYEMPLPEGYTYKALQSGDEGYTEGYRWFVEAPAETVSADSKLDGVWGLTTTWDEGGVPTSKAIATVDHNVSVKSSGEGATEKAYAEQVFISEDATLTVEDGVLLTVGDGGMNIADGGKMVIKPGAVVKVGLAGVTATKDDAILIKATDGKAGAFLIAPGGNEATRPNATVEMYTRARAISDVEHRWQHFAIPTIGKPSVTPLPHDKTEDANLIYIYEWNYDNQEWQTLGSWDKLCNPFQGYNLTNNLPADTYDAQGGVTYVFHGNIIGNGDGDLKFLSKGYNFFGNSYTAPIDIATMFESLGDNIEKTIAIYDVEKNQYIYSNNVTIELGFGTTNQINPLQGFFLNAKIANPGNPTINYKDAVYNNNNLEPGHGGLAAPAHKAQNINANTVAIHVEANGNADCITLVEMNDLSDDFENGFDATKLMNESNLNLYANTMAGKLGIVATDDLVGTTMDFQSNDATQYTMTFSNVNGQVYELLDVMTGVRTRMEEGATYTFNAGANITTANRFQICVAHTLPTGFETIESQAAAQGIYTILGQPMGHNWNRLPAGVYVINGERVVKF